MAEGLKRGMILNIPVTWEVYGPCSGNRAIDKDTEVPQVCYNERVLEHSLINANCLV